MNKKIEYGLVWDREREKEKVVLDCEEKTPILNEVKEKDIKTNEDKPTNILIEGDNYHALTCLNKTHKEKIDVIYIDPPYNTGNKDWKYNNNYVDKKDVYRHSKWLNMMEKRIKLARNLLTKKGFFVVSIDHYELFSLGLLCDKIFGEENRIGVISVIHKAGGRNQAKFLAPSNEFMLIYGKNKKNMKFNDISLNEENRNRFNLKDEKGRYMLINFLRDHIDNLREKKPNLWYPIYVNKDLKEISFKEKENFEKILPISNSGREMSWKTLKETFLEDYKNGEIEILKENNKINIYRKYREKEILKTHWNDKKYNSTHYGTRLIREIIGKEKFNFPKSLYLIEDILKISSKKNSIILDFFAGSGTTGHAVLKLNKEDKGNRQFILCTNNENKICEEVAYPRIQKVISGYYKNGIKEEDKYVEGFGGNLKYYKTDFVY